MARIAVGGFHHETNCFVAERTDFAYFASHRDRPPLVRGKDVIEWLADTSFALSGFLRDMGARHEIVPLLWTSGGAGGLVTADAYERIAGELVGRLRAAMPVDAVYLDLHGAMVSEPFEDGEGELLRRVRAAVGPKVPIAISLDYHANVTPEMVEYTDSLVAYRTYPHVDRPETGQFAARALSLLLERGRPPGRALRKLPFLIPLNDQCTLVEPSKGVVARSVVAEGELVNLSYLAGFPPSDLYWCGPAVIAHAWSQAAADRAADALAREIALREPEFAVPMVSPEEGVREAMAIARSASQPGGAVRHAGQSGLRRHGRYHRRARDARPARRRGRRGRLSLRCRGGGRGAQGRRGRRHRHRPRRPLGPRRRHAARRHVPRRSARHRQDAHHRGQVSGGRDIDLGPMALLTIGGVGVAVTSQAHAGAGSGALPASGRRAQGAEDPGPQEHLPFPRRVRADRGEGHRRHRARRLPRRSRAVPLPAPAPRRPPAPARTRPAA